jgi:hypothetical protein
MRLVDHIEIGPFTASYHRALVNDVFISSLASFLDDALLSQCDMTPDEAEGSLVAVFDAERYCGENSLVRDLFTLDLRLFADDGVSEIKADIVYDPQSRNFAARPGHNRRFYLWTPRRKEIREDHLAAIQRIVDDVLAGRTVVACCPFCSGAIDVVNDRSLFDVRCLGKRCFEYNYHKDDRGRLLHGHFFTSPAALP